MKREELELTRRGVTPAQFAAYVRQMLKKHGYSEEIDFEYWKRGGDIEFDYHDDPTRPAAAERGVSKPFQMQTYIRNWDGTVYNLIMEFDFWDDRTGFGYFYYRCDWGSDTDTNDTTDNKKEDETMTTTINTTTAATLTNGESINTAERVLNAAEDLINATKCRSAWAKGVNVYALELLEDLRESCTGGWFEEDDLGSARLVERGLLNGASDWNQYSWGGCSLIYDPQIAQRLCTPSELKITRNGERNPNSREQWLDTQARALYQAARIVVDAVTRSYAFNA